MLVSTELASSRGDAKRALAEGSVYVNNERATDDHPGITEGHLMHGRWVLLRRGKKRWHLALDAD